MGRPKKYTKKGLEKAVERYFQSISRTVTVTEPKSTGQRDSKGHLIYEDVPVLNDLGQEIRKTEYVIPPSVGDLAEFLGIHRSTWEAYCDSEAYPEFSDTTTRARGRMQAYLERESLTRQGKDLKGVIFNLQNNYGYSDKLEISGGVEEFLKKRAQEDGGQSF